MFKKILLSTILAGFAMASININTATKEELMSLKGVGEAKANAIIEYRKNNKFKSIEDLKNVPGIGDKNFDSFKNELSISGATSINKSAKEKLSAKTSELKDKADKIKDKENKTVKESKKDAGLKIESKKEQTKLDLEKKANKEKDKLKQKLDKAISK